LKAKQTVESILNWFDEVAASPIWQAYAEEEALKMVQAVSVQNAASWREAAKKSRRGHDIYLGLQAELKNNQTFISSANRNASLIKSLPLNVAERISKFAASEAIKGKRFDDLIAEIKRLAPEVSRSKAKLIARTEVSKAQADITENRAQRLGLNWYFWKGALDERERESHRHLEMVACRFSDPPNPEALIGIKSNLGHYNAGHAPNCRCFESVIIDPDFVKYPIRCYMGGRIISLSKAEFMKVF